MSATITAPAPRVTAGLAVGALAVPALAVVALVALHPVPGLLALAGLAAVTAMAWRVEWALVAYVGLAPFADALRSASSVSIKAVGALLFVAWLVRLLADRRPVALRHPALVAAGALLLALLLATVVHANGSAGLTVVVRYLSYLGVLVVLVDVLRGRLRVGAVVEVFVWSCTAAAVAGIVVYLVGDEGRAHGPLADPNDLAFYLVCALPLAWALGRAAPGRVRLLYAGATALLLCATALTFSRGAVVGVVAMLGYALAVGLLRWRTAVAGVLLAAVAAGAVAAVDPTLVRDSLQAKQHIAQQNVDDRFVTWSVAAEMIADSPVVGKGPAGYAAGYDHYLGTRLTDPPHLDVAHQMYLEVGSELGLLGLSAFVATLWAGFRGARRAAGGAGESALLGSGVATAFVGVGLAACFLSEQYYLPVWLLVGLGAVLDPVVRSR